MTLPSFIIITLLSFSPVYCRLHTLKLQNDLRRSILCSSFGYKLEGILNVEVSGISNNLLDNIAFTMEKSSADGIGSRSKAKPHECLVMGNGLVKKLESGVTLKLNTNFPKWHPSVAPGIHFNLGNKEPQLAFKDKDDGNSLQSLVDPLCRILASIKNSSANKIKKMSEDIMNALQNNQKWLQQTLVLIQSNNSSTKTIISIFKIIVEDSYTIARIRRFIEFPNKKEYYDEDINKFANLENHKEPSNISRNFTKEQSEHNNTEKSMPLENPTANKQRKQANQQPISNMHSANSRTKPEDLGQQSNVKTLFAMLNNVSDSKNQNLKDIKKNATIQLPQHTNTNVALIPSGDKVKDAKINNNVPIQKEKQIVEADYKKADKNDKNVENTNNEAKNQNNNENEENDVPDEKDAVNYEAEDYELAAKAEGPLDAALMNLIKLAVRKFESSPDAFAYLIQDNKISVNFSFVIASEGNYELYFHNCFNHPADITITMTEKNGDNYVSVGEKPLFEIFTTFAVIYLFLSLVWMLHLRLSKSPVFRIHHLMLAMILVKSLSLAFHAINFYIIGKYGVPEEGWAVMYYIAHMTRGFLFFVTIMMIGAGWTFIQHAFTRREKNVFLIVIPLQILANVATIVMAESEIGAYGFVTWDEIFTIVDLLCCVTILLPVIWSIRHLQQASRIDGKAAQNLRKLRLFRHFYIMVICFIYFTRIIVYLLKITVPFQLIWLVELFEQIITLIFLVTVGYKFRPFSDNPYLQLPSDDDAEDTLMERFALEEAWSQSGLTNGVTRLHRPQGVDEVMAGRRKQHLDEVADIEAALAESNGLQRRDSAKNIASERNPNV